MASEPAERRPVALTLPPSLEAWVSERAEDSGIGREELVVALLAAYRDATEGTDETVPDPEAVVEERVGPLIDRRLEQFDEDVERKLDEIRRRVVQLKGETESKAAVERVEALESRLDELEETVQATRSDTEDRTAELESEVEQLRETVETDSEADVDTTVEDEAADERLSDVESKLTQVARAVVALRDDQAGEPTAAGGDEATLASGRVADTESEADTEPERSGTERPVEQLTPEERLLEIRRTAAKWDTDTAECADCGGSVNLALLPEARCPHCGVAVAELEARDGVLTTPLLHPTAEASDE